MEDDRDLSRRACGGVILGAAAGNKNPSTLSYATVDKTVAPMSATYNPRAPDSMLAPHQACSTRVTWQQIPRGMTIRAVLANRPVIAK